MNGLAMMMERGNPEALKLGAVVDEFSSCHPQMELCDLGARQDIEWCV